MNQLNLSCCKVVSGGIFNNLPAGTQDEIAIGLSQEINIAGMGLGLAIGLISGNILGAVPIMMVCTNLLAVGFFSTIAFSKGECHA